MKQIVAVLLVLVGIFIPGTSLSRHEMTGGVKNIDRSEILEIKANLRHHIEDLSLLKAELVTLFASMTASQGKERYFIMHSEKNIKNIEGIYRYAETTLNELLLVGQDKISYYHYLKEYEIEKMRGRVKEYLGHLQEARGEISNKNALRAIGRATETIRSSSELLARTFEIVQQHRSEREQPLRHH
jgi:hypothetical protein